MNKIKSKLEIQDHISIYREDSVTKERVFLSQHTNVTITAYKTRVMNRMVNSASTDLIAITKMSWGTSAALASIGDVDLGTLVLTKGLNNTPEVFGDTIIYEGRLDASEGDVAIREVGLKTSDNLLAAKVNVSVDKLSTEILVFTWTKTITSS